MERRTVGAFKKVALMVLGTAMQTYGDKLTDQQEVLSFAADILIETYASESAVMRARQSHAVRVGTRQSSRSGGSRVYGRCGGASRGRGQIGACGDG